MDKLKLNNGMELRVVKHCSSNPDFAAYRLIGANGKIVGEEKCSARILPSRLQKFLERKINCIFESDRVMLNNYIRSMYSEKTNHLDMAKVTTRDDAYLTPTPAYAQVHKSVGSFRR